MSKRMQAAPTAAPLTSLTAAAKACGIHVSTWTLLRLARQGSGGIRLEAVRAGGRWLCSVQAMRAFLRRRTETALGRETAPRTAWPKREQVAARTYLDSIGLSSESDT